MIEKLDFLFRSTEVCKEKTHPCKMSKKSIVKIYKPDSGIQNKKLQERLFPMHPPKLSDCVMLYSGDKLAIIEIKCGKVTKSLLNDVFEKVTNTFKILKDQEIVVTKCMLLYQRFEDNQMRKLLASKRIYGQPILGKKYENEAMDI